MSRKILGEPVEMWVLGAVGVVFAVLIADAMDKKNKADAAAAGEHVSHGASGEW
jgi:hypothetical protein